MSELERFGVSVESDLLAAFDAEINKRGYDNRSEAIRDIMREYLVSRNIESGETEMVATITIVYDHHTTDTGNQITTLQHDFDGRIFSSMHVHLDHNDCLEVLVAVGKPETLYSICDRISALRGVKFGKTVIAASNQ